MTATPIRPDVTLSAAKQQYLDYVAQMFDAFAERFGNEPTALVFGFNDDKGESGAHWLMPDKEPGSMCAMLLDSVAVRIMSAALKG